MVVFFLEGGSDEILFSERVESCSAATKCVGAHGCLLGGSSQCLLPMCRLRASRVADDSVLLESFNLR
jgi:hypothetical protein